MLTKRCDEATQEIGRLEKESSQFDLVKLEKQEEVHRLEKESLEFDLMKLAKQEEARRKKRLFAATLLGCQVVVAAIGFGMLKSIANFGPKSP